jgi:hypothetical protein
MGLDFAIDELYATGWSAADPSGCEVHSDGRYFPGVPRVRAEFAAAGLEFSTRYLQLFDCHRAEWRDPAADSSGAVVGRTEAEAAVYALSQMRRCLSGVGAT